MKKINLTLGILLGLLMASGAEAAFSPIALDIAAPVQLPPQDFSITGLRLSVIYGRHRNMYGIDIGGIGNISDLESGGIAVSGIFNYHKGNTTGIGLQLAGITNINEQKTKVYGIQAALVNSNWAESTIIGIEAGPIANLGPHTTVGGIAAGIYNKAYEVYGIQVGVVNFVTQLHGLQIGLLNFNEKGLFPVCPFLNFGM